LAQREPETIRRREDGEGRVREEEQAVEGNDPPKWWPVVGETALYCFRKLSPISKQVQKGFAEFA